MNDEDIFDSYFESAKSRGWCGLKFWRGWRGSIKFWCE